MTFKEALKALSEGKKVRRTSWQPGDYIHIVDNEIVTDDDLEHQLQGGGDWELFTYNLKDVFLALAAGKTVRHASRSYSLSIRSGQLCVNGAVVMVGYFEPKDGWEIL